MAHRKSGSGNGSPSDPEDAIQAAKYQELLRLIAEALSRGEDFECVGADQIALLRWRDARKAKRVYCSKEPYPYRRRGLSYTLSYTTYLRWEAFLEFCGIHGLDPRRESGKYGFGPMRSKPKEPAKDERTASPADSAPPKSNSLEH